MHRGAAPQVESTSTQSTARPSASVSTTVPGIGPRGLSGIEYPRFFTREGLDPFDEVEWDVRSAVIGNEKGNVVFEQRDVEVPKFWSQQATNIVVSKYFRGTIGTPERERSVKQLIGRHHHPVGARADVFRERRRSAGIQRRPEAPARVSEGGVQQSRVVQLRV